MEQYNPGGYVPKRPKRTELAAVFRLMAEADGGHPAIETHIESDLHGVTVHARLAAVHTDYATAAFHPVRTYPTARLKDAVQFARQIRRGEIAETDVREMARAYRAPKLIEPEDIVVEMF